MIRLLAWIPLIATGLFAVPRFEVRLANGIRSTPVDGRLILVVAARPQPEPRFQVAWGIETAQIFGIDVENWQPGHPVVFDEKALGHPLPDLSALAAGVYHIQAVLNVYETVRRNDGHTLKVPWDDGEGQLWNRSPGNLHSTPRQVDVAADSVIPVVLDKAIPEIPAPQDTQYVRRVRYQSKMLSEFWGRPVTLGAIVLVPPGFDETPEQRYPVVYQQGHFPTAFRSFRDAPLPRGAPEAARRATLAANRFHADWIAGRLPKMLLVLTQHPTPFYDDSYGVNSANGGPYGDALTQEFYLWLEHTFRAIGEPWARVLAGGSTGGWMSLAQQIFYPDFFGGAWCFCPDPVDFHAFQLTDVYRERNAHFDSGPFGRLPKPLGRSRTGSLLATTEGMSRQELVLGTRGRSGGQLDAFHSVFGPVGPDGYPAKLWDPLTGAIDTKVAKYWTENYDLTAILKRSWGVLGPRLVGKIHITMGTKDTFFLEGAAERMQEFLESTKEPHRGPYYGGSVVFGNNQPHCYPGEVPSGISLEQYYLPIWAEHIRKSAPAGADTRSWLP